MLWFTSAIYICIISRRFRLFNAIEQLDNFVLTLINYNVDLVSCLITYKKYMNFKCSTKN